MPFDGITLVGPGNHVLDGGQDRTNPFAAARGDAVVNSRIDYCNTVLAGAPRTVRDKLQRALNAAARVVTGTWKLTAAWVRYLMTNFTGSTSPTGCFSSWQ